MSKEVAHETEVKGYAHLGLGLCAVCLAENFRHDPGDPHLLHLAEADVQTHMAITVMGGEGRCVDHAIAYLS